MAEPAVIPAPPRGILAGKIAIVTGGATGVGEETVRHFIAEGARGVVIGDIFDNPGMHLARSLGPNRCMYVHCDVRNEAQVRELVDSTIRIYQRLDIMFCNSGTISPSEQTVLNLDFFQLTNLFALNVQGMAFCVKHAARAMVDHNTRGSIICMGGVAASHGKKKHTDYVMSKHAVLGLVRCASAQLGMRGVRVNCISPFGLTISVSEGPTTQKEYEEELQLCSQNSALRGTILVQRDIASAVAFLASDQSKFITGQDLILDGGLTVTDY